MFLGTLRLCFESGKHIVAVGEGAELLAKTVAKRYKLVGIGGMVLCFERIKTVQALLYLFKTTRLHVKRLLVVKKRVGNVGNLYPCRLKALR